MTHMGLRRARLIAYEPRATVQIDISNLQKFRCCIVHRFFREIEMLQTRVWSAMNTRVRCRNASAANLASMLQTFSWAAANVVLLYVDFYLGDLLRRLGICCILIVLCRIGVSKYCDYFCTVLTHRGMKCCNSVKNLRRWMGYDKCSRRILRSMMIGL